MTIQELLNAVVQYDPNLVVEAWDNTSFKPGVVPDRKVHIRVWHKSKDGSDEPVELRMRGDQVLVVEPGTTARYWQVEPIATALRANQDRSA